MRPAATRVLAGPVTLAAGAGAGVLYTLALRTPPSATMRRLVLALVATVVLSSTLTLVRLLGRGRSGLVAHAVLLDLVLAPAWLLVSLPAATCGSLGARHPLTLALIAVTALLPLLLALRATFGEDGLPTRWLAQAAVMSLSTILGLALLEAGVRLTGADPGPPPPTFRETRYETQESPLPRLRWQLAPRQTWKTIYPSNERGYFDADNSVTYRINSQGFRGPDLSPERRPGVRRVALLGDSFAFGIGVKEQDALGPALERALQSGAGCPTEVLSFAVFGYSTVQEEVLLRKRVLGYQPDLVIVWYFLNDPDIEEGTIRFLAGNKALGLLPWARRVSALARLVSTRLESQLSLLAFVRTYTEAYRPADPRWLETQEALGRLGRLSRERGVPVVLFVHPVLFALDGRYPFADVHRQVLETARHAGLTAYDLFETFEGRRGEELWVHRCDQHPNEKGQAIAAAYAAEKLRSLLPPCAPATR